MINFVELIFTLTTNFHNHQIHHHQIYDKKKTLTNTLGLCSSDTSQLSTTSFAVNFDEN